MGKFNITSEELAEALDIELERLIDICDFFDSDPDDDWELTEGIHFEWGGFGSRTFSPEGAVEICKYLEENWNERSAFNRLKRWLLRRDQRLKGLMVAKRVQESSEVPGQLVFLGRRAFLGPRACREVLGLGRRQDVLNRTFSEIMKSENTDIEPLKINEDFFKDEDEHRYFSRSGIALVGKQLNTTLTRKHRRDWAKVVEEYAPRALKAIEEHEAAKGRHIQQAMDRVRRQANGRCQLTNRRRSVARINLEVHHLFDKKTYPQFADREDNLIAIGNDIHQHFHKWMGGPHASCTVEDMERYIEEFGNVLFPEGNAEQLTKVSIRLSRAKQL